MPLFMHHIRYMSSFPAIQQYSRGFMQVAYMYNIWYKPDKIDFTAQRSMCERGKQQYINHKRKNSIKLKLYDHSSAGCSSVWHLLILTEEKKPKYSFEFCIFTEAKRLDDGHNVFGLCLLHLERCTTLFFCLMHPLFPLIDNRCCCLHARQNRK